MKLSGWIFLISSWLFIIAVMFFSYLRVLRKK